LFKNRNIRYRQVARKAAHYGVSLFFLLGVIGGIRFFFSSTEYASLVDGTSYVEAYLRQVFTKHRGVEEEQQRTKFLQENSFAFTEIIHEDVHVSVVTSVQKKRELTTHSSVNLFVREYVYMIDYAYRLEKTQTQYSQETVKLVLLYDKTDRSYLVEKVSAFDYEYDVGLSDGARKEVEEKRRSLLDVGGTNISEDEREGYIRQLTLFFDTYSTDIEQARSLVSTQVTLPILRGQFETKTLKVVRSAKKEERVTLFVEIDYEHSDGSLRYKKEYKITLVGRTIVELEEV